MADLMVPEFELPEACKEDPFAKATLQEASHSEGSPSTNEGIHEEKSDGTQLNIDTSVRSNPEMSSDAPSQRPMFSRLLNFGTGATTSKTASPPPKEQESAPSADATAQVESTDSSPKSDAQSKNAVPAASPDESGATGGLLAMARGALRSGSKKRPDQLSKLWCRACC